MGLRGTNNDLLSMVFLQHNANRIPSTFLNRFDRIVRHTVNRRGSTNEGQRQTSTIGQYQIDTQVQL